MKKILPLIAVFFALAFKHPFYLGVCDLKYDQKEKVLQGTVKLFVNDLEAALLKLNGKKTDLINYRDTSATTKVLEDYLYKRLALAVNGKKLGYKLLGFERESEAVWLYVEARECPEPHKILITNTLLYDFIASQMHIAHLEVNGVKKSLKIVNPEKELFFEF